MNGVRLIKVGLIDLTLQQRGIQPSSAGVIAEVGAAIWKVALENWRKDELNEGSQVTSRRRLPHPEGVTSFC